MTITRWCVVAAIIVGVAIIARLSLKGSQQLKPEHQRLSRMFGKLSTNDEEGVHVLLIRSGRDNLSANESKTRLAWKWRIQTPNDEAYSVFSCIGQVPSEGNVFAEFSRSRDRQTRVTAFSRRLECSSLKDYEVKELGPFITLSFEFDEEGNRWYTKSDFDGTLNRYPNVFRFLSDPENFVVEVQTVNQLKSYGDDEIVQLFRIRSKEVSQVKMIDGKEVDLYHGMYVFLVPIDQGFAFRESAGF